MWILRRLAVWIVTVWAAATFTFLLPKLSPRDPVLERLSDAIANGGASVEGLQDLANAYRARFGLDRSLLDQYFDYITGLARFDLGISIAEFPTPVTSLILNALPWTMGLLVVATLIAFVLGSFLGALSGWGTAPRWMRGIVPSLTVMSAVPYYLIGLILIYFLSHRAGLFPTGGGYGIGRQPQLTMSFVTELLYHAMLPAISIVLASTGAWAVSMRGIMVSIRGEDYVTFSVARGLKPWRIFAQYGIRNALLPQLTGLGLALGYVVAGAILVEVVFAYPGIGSLLLRGVSQNDYFVIYGVVFTIILAIATATLVLDLVYPLLDPRIRREGR